LAVLAGAGSLKVNLTSVGMSATPEVPSDFFNFTVATVSTAWVGSFMKIRPELGTERILISMESISILTLDSTSSSQRDRGDHAALRAPYRAG
jgi:hypothetical protein